MLLQSLHCWALQIHQSLGWRHQRQACCWLQRERHEGHLRPQKLVCYCFQRRMGCSVAAQIPQRTRQMRKPAIYGTSCSVQHSQTAAIHCQQEREAHHQCSAGEPPRPTVRKRLHVLPLRRSGWSPHGSTAPCPVSMWLLDFYFLQNPLSL